MHTYRKAEIGWVVGFRHPSGLGSFDVLGPIFGVECEAAAYASFLNGGRYNPYEIEALFRMEPTLVEDDSTYPRPQGMDYEPEAARK